MADQLVRLRTALHRSPCGRATVARDVPRDGAVWRERAAIVRRSRPSVFAIIGLGAGEDVWWEAWQADGHTSHLTLAAALATLERAGFATGGAVWEPDDRTPEECLLHAIFGASSRAEFEDFQRNAARMASDHDEA